MRIAFSYGDNAPPFFVGELKDAAKKAFEPEAFEDRKLLALYLHNDHAVAHNIFPTKVELWLGTPVRLAT